MKILYLNYILLLIFNNAINFLVYIKNVLQNKYINKDFDNQKAFLQYRRYKR